MAKGRKRKSGAAAGAKPVPKRTRNHRTAKDPFEASRDDEHYEVDAVLPHARRAGLRPLPCRWHDMRRLGMARSRATATKTTNSMRLTGRSTTRPALCSSRSPRRPLCWRERNTGSSANPEFSPCHTRYYRNGTGMEFCGYPLEPESPTDTRNRNRNPNSNSGSVA